MESTRLYTLCVHKAKMLRHSSWQSGGIGCSWLMLGILLKNPSPHSENKIKPRSSSGRRENFLNEQSYFLLKQTPPNNFLASSGLTSDIPQYQVSANSLIKNMYKEKIQKETCGIKEANQQFHVRVRFTHTIPPFPFLLHLDKRILSKNQNYT